MKHNIVLKGYGAYFPTTPSKMLCLGTAESYGIEQLDIIPGAGWEGLVIKATFHPASSEPVVMVVGENGGVIDVPPEATAKATAESSPGVIVFSGVADGVQRISANLAYTVIGHASVEGKESEPTPSQWEQLAAQYQSKIDKQQGAENAGKFLAVGENGEVALSEGVKPEQIAAAVDAYLDENPIEAGATKEEAAQIRQNKTDIETLQKDKLSASELDSAIDSALAEAKASGEFDGKDGDPFTYEDFTEEQLAALKGKDGDDYTLTEADKTEIAEQAAQLVKVPEVEIPDKLPNPNALTFTGAVTGTYDGSAPLTVEIPQGGAGGGEWKLIRSFTIPEDVTTDNSGIAWAVSESGGVRWAFDTDSDGNPFEYSEIMIRVHGLFSQTANYCYDNNENLAPPSGSMNSAYIIHPILQFSTQAQKRTKWAWLERLSEVKGFWCACGDRGSSSDTIFRDRDLVDIPEKFTKFSYFPQSNSTLGMSPGDTVSVYGR